MKDEKNCICVCFAMFPDAFRTEKGGFKNRLAEGIWMESGGWWKTDVIQMIPKKENENNWSILVNIMSSKSFITISEDFIKGLFESESPTKDPLAKLTILEKSNEKENVWIIFKTEAFYQQQ